ncbi:MAG: NADP-dependent oxidoreductase [Acidobacteriales bacterium]|nr:NADP-dependent oxidoreductase [Terriglobales bacterium]
MRAFQVEDLAQGAPLSLTKVPVPAPGSGQVLIKVHAAGATPTELLWYPTSHQENGAGRRHAIPGHEFSGTVAGLGKGVSGFAPGDEVYGMNDWYWEGATAEYCLTTPSSIALKPKSLTHVEAATVPISALTAWQGLFDRAKIQGGERILVQGGAGGVGLFVVQLAHRHGAHVIATASKEDISLLQSLGAAEVIDYKAARFEDGLAAIDVVFDTVGGSIRKRSAAVLKPGGRLISVAADGETSTDPQATRPDFIVEPNQAQLTEIARILDQAVLKTFVKGVVPFKDAALAYTGAVPGKRTAGKFVVEVVSA